MIIGVQLVAGFVFLYLGAREIVSGACLLADRFGLPRSFVGLTIVAFGTSAPELIVNVLAASNNHTQLALSNVAGSNLANLCLGFGGISLVSSVVLKRNKFQIDYLLATLAPGFVLILFFYQEPPQIPLWAVIPFILATVFYLFTLNRRNPRENSVVLVHGSTLKAFIRIIAGAALLYFGGEFVLRSSVSIARSFGLTESIIGLTIVACGTSLPDVAASVIAALRKENDIAVGNLLGSNISNIFVVLGATILTSRTGLIANQAVIIDYVAVFILTSAFAIFAYATERLPRVLGCIFIVAFSMYYVWRITGI